MCRKPIQKYIKKTAPLRAVFQQLFAVSLLLLKVLQLIYSIYPELMSRFGSSLKRPYLYQVPTPKVISFILPLWCLLYRKTSIYRYHSPIYIAGIIAGQE